MEERVSAGFYFSGKINENLHELRIYLLHGLTRQLKEHSLVISHLGLFHTI